MNKQTRGFISLILVIIVMLIIVALGFYAYQTMGTNKLATQTTNDIIVSDSLSQTDDVATIQKEFDETNLNLESLDAELNQLDSEADSL
ncbi:hypothetical protein IPM62_04995 [Candidatus Woesebacteria bacterium]|nr:MAG: hypothetical protein IPM62_04995 [Candidatus Woesebacteria bacterium]